MPRVARTNDRVLLAEFDSTQQRAGMSGPGWLADLQDSDSAILREALGKLRLEALLSERIVVTDAQALDGRLFLGLASSGLLKKLRTDPEQPLPIELRARAATVKATVAAMHQPGSDLGFQSSFLTNGDRVAREMTRSVHRKRQPYSRKGILTCLRRSGAADDELEALAEGWAKLAELTEAKVLPLRTWAQSRPWSEAAELSDRFLPVSVLAATFTQDEAEAAFMHDLGRETKRSVFLDRLDRWEGRSDVAEKLGFWFSERYNRTIAFQHHADYRSIHSDPKDGIHFSESERFIGGRRATEIQLPGGFLERLGELTTDEWQRGYSQVKNPGAKSSIVAWWKYGDTGSLQRSLDHLVGEWGASESDPSQSTQRTRPRFAPVITFGASLLAPVAALPLEPDLLGYVATVLLTLGVTVPQWLMTQSTETTCAVTDYLDDVASS